jgi:H+/gluconate symporter-like permease
MAMGSKTTIKIIGIALLITGAGLALWGYQLSGSVGSQLTQAFTGSDTDKVMTLYISGAVSLVVGLFLVIKK